jgi:hypothetical protein
MVCNSNFQDRGQIFKTIILKHFKDLVTGGNGIYPVMENMSVSLTSVKVWS